MGCQLMQSNWKVSGKVIGMAVFTAILCIFIQISMFALIKSFSTEVVGYDVYYVENNGDQGEFVGYFAKDELPEDLDLNHYKPLSKYSPVPTSAKVVEVVLSTFFSVGVLFCTVGSVLADVAAKDRNNSDFNGIEHNKNRGLIIGLMSAIPAGAAYVGTVVLRFFPATKVTNWYFWFYRFIIMGPVKPLNDIMTDTKTDLSQMPWWWVIAHGLFLVLFVLICYLMYRICYNEDSWLAKVLYKSKETNNVRRLGGR